MGQNCKCRLCDVRNEMVDPFISECNKVALNKYKTMYNGMGKNPLGIVQEIKI